MVRGFWAESAVGEADVGSAKSKGCEHALQPTISILLTALAAPVEVLVSSRLSWIRISPTRLVLAQAFVQ